MLPVHQSNQKTRVPSQQGKGEGAWINENFEKSLFSHLQKENSANISREINSMLYKETLAGFYKQDGKGYTISQVIKKKYVENPS